MALTKAETVSLRVEEIRVGNVLCGGAFFSPGSRDQEIRSTAGGDEHRFPVLGGTLLEDALAGHEQVSGLDAPVALLRRSPS